MRLQSLLPSALLVLTASASTTGKTTATQLRCITEYGKFELRQVPSRTVTWTIDLPHVIAYTTTTPTQQITLPASTITSTQTTTSVATVTASSVTDVFSTTSTVFITTTSSSYLSTTSTVTDPVNTETDQTTTTEAVPTSPGFLPVADTTNSVYPGQKKRWANPHGPSILERNSPKLGCKEGSRFPECVECVKQVEIWETQVAVITARKTSTLKVTPKPSTKTVTSTAISTSTVVPPDVSSTVSFTTTSTISTSTLITSTFTSTSTNTVTVTSTVTTFDACSTSNILTSVNVDGVAYGIDNYFNNGGDSGTSYYTVSSGAPYDCCVQCQGAAVCDAFIFADSTCLIITNPSDDSYGAQCGPQSSGPGYYTYNSESAGYTVGNGNCGYAYQGPME